MRGTSEPPGVLARRRKVSSAVAVAGTGLLGASLSTEPGSPRFYRLTSAVAATWLAGGLASGPLHLGQARHPVRTPVALGVATFGVFYCGARISRRIPVLNRAISGVLQYAHHGADRSVLLTTLANGAAEEVFFRGAIYAAASGHAPLRTSTIVYAMSTLATRNPALVLASIVMGTVFGLQREITGGIQAPLITHLVWSTLMVRFLPPLFR